MKKSTKLITKARRIVVIDNFDSFTFNLVEYFKQCRAHVTVYRNTTSPRTIMRAKPCLIVYSPGPGNPRQAGRLLEYIDYFSSRLPQFGVCLGLQAMVEAFGGTLRVLKKPLHGKASLIRHDGMTIFQHLSNPVSVGRYHSLAADRVPRDFVISATTITDHIVMAIRHVRLPIEAVQFHPESILTNPRLGLALIRNVLKLADKAPAAPSPAEPRFGFSSENRPLLLEAASPFGTPSLPLLRSFRWGNAASAFTGY